MFITFTYDFKVVAKILKNHLIETDETYDKLYDHITSFFH